MGTLAAIVGAGREFPLIGGGISSVKGKTLSNVRVMGEQDHQLVTVDEDDEEAPGTPKPVKNVKMETESDETLDEKIEAPPSRRQSVTWGVVLGNDTDADGDADDATQSSGDAHHSDQTNPSDEEPIQNPEPKKKRRPTFPKLFFPGLRKDSIAMYKATKFLGANVDDEDDDDDNDGDDNKYTPNGDSGYGHDDDSDRQSDDHVVLPAITLPPAGLSPTGSILKRRSSSIRMEKPAKDSFFVVLSGLYAMFIVTLGAVLPIAEVFAKDKHPIHFEMFYIYIYGGSVFFLVYVYVYLLGNHRSFRFRSLLNRQDSSSSQKKKKKRKVSVDEVDSHTGSFYLRLGALAFGVGSMIHSGLQFGQYFDTPCEHAIFAVRPIIHLVFTFVQLYFVFMNSKMCINRYKTIARFGLMHMVATNICVWLDTIVTETMHQFHIDSHADDQDANDSHAQPHDVITAYQGHAMNDNHAANLDSSITQHVASHVTTTISDIINETVQQLGHHGDLHHGSSGAVKAAATVHVDMDDCVKKNLMTNILETAGPYLYPCTIEYSLICAGILYILWGNIGKRVMGYKAEDGEDEATKHQRLSVDCSNSSRGLFIGILVLVGTVITMVMFFVLVENKDYYETGLLVQYLTEIFLYVFSTVAVLLAALRMRTLRFNSTRETDFEEILILISLAGEFMFDLLSVTAAWFEKDIYGSELSIVAKLFGLIQSSIQSMFVLNGLRRSARTHGQERLKQGREFVTFLLISNISMWCVNTFALQRGVANPVQIHYYGALAWNILTHISIPLAIFFRFHSTVCLSNVWKRSWKGGH